jgi:hypothetical protein
MLTPLEQELLAELQKVARIMRFGEKVELGQLAGMASELRRTNKTMKDVIARAEAAAKES